MPRSLLLLLLCLLSPGLCDSSSAPGAKRHQERGGVEEVGGGGSEEGTGFQYGRLLLTLVQQQSSLIGHLESDLTAYKTQVQGDLTAYKTQVQEVQSDLTAYKTQVQGDLTAYKTQVTSMTSQLQKVQRKMEDASKPVFFTAHMTTSPVNIGQHSPFIFDSVVTNIGGGYNPHTGVFIAPVAGVYVFYTQLMKHSTTSYIHWGIYKSGTALCVNGVSQSYDKSSCLATVRLQKGDTVLVKKSNDYRSPGYTLQGMPFCSFSGFLSSVED